MPEIRVNSDVCTKCGLCTQACPTGIFLQPEKGVVPRLVRKEMCIDCGHCVAICPSGAVVHGGYPEGAVTPVNKDALPSYEQVLELARARRSRRRFEDRPVEKEDVEKVLEAARFAPSGHNAQPTEYVVIRDKDRLKTVSAMTADALEKTMKPFTSPIGRTIMRLVIGKRQAESAVKFAPELMGLVELCRAGNDLILNDAPTVVVFHADESGVSSEVDVSLSLQNATLAAEALGLGCFYCGFVLMACGRHKGLREFVSVPDTNKVYGVLAMGYPKLKYGKWPERRPARVKWM